MALDTKALGARLNRALAERYVDGFFLAWERSAARPIDAYPVLDEEISRSVRQAVPLVQTPSTPPRDNRTAWWLIGIGVFLVVGNLSLLGTATGLGWGNVVALIIGAVIVLIGQQMWTSAATHGERVEAAIRNSADERQREIRRLSAELTDIYRRHLHEMIGIRLGVPARLRTDFGIASRAQENYFRHEWTALVDWWASQPTFPDPPPASPIRLGHDEYEEYCARWLHSHGILDAKVTRYSRDGGVDVESSGLVVQCKHYDGGYVGVRDVREIFGVATVRKKRAVVITSGSFTKDAIAFAEEAEVALSYLDERTGKHRAITSAAGKFGAVQPNS